MTNLVDLNAAIDSRAASFTVSEIYRDNEKNELQNQHEYIRLTVDGGDSFIARRTGLLDIRGTTIRHPLLLTFSVFTKANEGTLRSDELCQALMDHWQTYKLTPRVQLLEASHNRVGEAGPRYQAIVRVSGFRDELRITT